VFSPLGVDISNHFIYVVGYTLEGIADEEENEFYYSTKVYLLSINSKHEIKL
jgi:hypothetical protein